MKNKINGRTQVRLLIWLVFAIFVVASYSLKNASGTVYYAMIVQSYAPILSPSVILENGTEATSFIYTNNTSAKIKVDATSQYTSYTYTLNITNTIADDWKAKLSVYSNESIARISNATIELHNGTDTPSTQIIVENGDVTVPEGEFYDLPGSKTIYIKISDLKEVTDGVSYLHVYLRVQEPCTSTYSLYVITFEFT